MVPLFVPEASALIQPELSVDDQETVPPPVLETVMYWVAGFVPPCIAVKERPVGFTPMTGVVAEVVVEPELVMVTVIGTVVVVAPVAEIVTVAL